MSPLMAKKKKTMFPQYFCSECQSNTAITRDYRAGHRFCSTCGARALLSELNHFDDSAGKPKKGLKLIGTMADRLRLEAAIKDRAGEIYKKVDDLKACGGRSMDSILAACLFIAWRENKLSRTFKEVSAVANGVSKTEINGAIEAIKMQLGVETRTVRPGELARRFCSKLGMENRAIESVQQAVDKIQEFDIRRSPNTVLAVIMYMVLQLSDDPDRVPLKDIAVAAEVSELTIRRSYKDISLYASMLIPRWYANPDDIRKIPTP